MPDSNNGDTVWTHCTLSCDPKDATTGAASLRTRCSNKASTLFIDQERTGQSHVQGGCYAEDYFWRGRICPVSSDGVSELPGSERLHACTGGTLWSSSGHNRPGAICSAPAISGNRSSYYPEDLTRPSACDTLLRYTSGPHIQTRTYGVVGVKLEPLF